MNELTRRMLVEPSIYGRAMGIAEEMAEIFSMLVRVRSKTQKPRIQITLRH